MAKDCFEIPKLGWMAGHLQGVGLRAKLNTPCQRSD